MLHQTIIGPSQKAVRENCDTRRVIGAPGGSNFAGLAFPSSMTKSTARRSISHPVETDGLSHPDQGPFATTTATRPDTRRFCPCTAWDTPLCRRPCRGGLRYHGMAPTVSQLVAGPSPIPRPTSDRNLRGRPAVAHRGRIPHRETNLPWPAW